MNIVKKAQSVLAWLRGPLHFVKQSVARELAEGEPEVHLVPLLGERDGDFLDVGANRGIYAYHALPHFRTVLAVEAHPALIAPLRAVLVPNGKVLPVALSDRIGTATLQIPVRGRRDVATRSSLNADANPGFVTRDVEVPTTTIDALGLDALSLIKIDVEGHEFAVLNGAVETLRSQKPVCIVECEERHNSGGVGRAFRFFAGLGYEAYYLHRGKLCDGAAFDAAMLQDAGQAKAVGGGRSPDYVNNFIFVHPARASALERIRAFLE